MGDSEIKKQTKSGFNRSGEEGPLPCPAASSPPLSQVFLQRLFTVWVLLAPFVLCSRRHPDTLVLYIWHDPGERATEAPWTCHSGPGSVQPLLLQTSRTANAVRTSRSPLQWPRQQQCPARLGWPRPGPFLTLVLSFRGPHRAPARYHLLCTAPGPAPRAPQGSPSCWGANLITRKVFVLASGYPLTAPTQHPALLRAAGHSCAQFPSKQTPPRTSHPKQDPAGHPLRWPVPC